MKRPLLPVALLYVGGILIACLISLPPLLLLAGALSVAALTLAWPRARLIGLCALIVLTGWTNYTLRTAVLSPHDLRRILGERTEIVTLRGILRETPTQRVYERGQQESWRTMARVDAAALRLNRQSWQPAAGRMAVTTQGILSTNFFAGQEVEITGVAGPPKNAAAEGTFDYRAYLNQLGIYYTLQAASGQDWRMVSSPSKPPLADRFRQWARRALALGLPVEDESLRLEWALTLGWKTALTEEVSEPFVQAATYHIFAVDGLRMAIIFGIFFGLFRAAASAPERVRAGADSVDLVLRRAHRLAGLRHSRHRYAERGHCRLGLAATERVAQLPLCRGAYHSLVGAAAALPGRLPTLVLCRPVHSF